MRELAFVLRTPGGEWGWWWATDETRAVSFTQSRFTLSLSSHSAGDWIALGGFSLALSFQLCLSLFLIRVASRCTARVPAKGARAQQQESKRRYNANQVRVKKI